MIREKALDTWTRMGFIITRRRSLIQAQLESGIHWMSGSLRHILQVQVQTLRQTPIFRTPPRFLDTFTKPKPLERREAPWCFLRFSIRRNITLPITRYLRGGAHLSWGTISISRPPLRSCTIIKAGHGALTQERNRLIPPSIISLLPATGMSCRRRQDSPGCV